MTTVTAIVDLQFGSTGKGLIAGYLSERRPFDTVVSANMPNAGHTFVDAHGNKWINKVLPSGVYSVAMKTVGIGPGAVFDPAQLVHEINQMYDRIDTHPRIMIHECAAILRPEHKTAEQKLNPISSTMQGSAEAMIEKIRREGFGGNTVQFNMELMDSFVTSRGEKLSDFVVMAAEWSRAMLASENILVEGSQGYSLGINAGFYPYCTSRDCTVWRLLADCAIPPTSQRHVIGTARVHPIRVGDTNGGTSGPCYGDQAELSWSNFPTVEPERTTVTGRIRRIFSFSERQIREAIFANGVDHVFLNFCNYDPMEAIRITNVINQIGAEAYAYRGLAGWVNEVPQFVRFMGFGPQSNHIMEHRGYTQ